MSTRPHRVVRDGVVRNHVVVQNTEEQFSVWPAGRELPPGWAATGAEGTREECLEHIGRVWTDLRPASLRRRQDGDER